MNLKAFYWHSVLLALIMFFFGCQEKTIPTNSVLEYSELEIEDSLAYLDDFKNPKNYLWLSKQDQYSDSVISNIPKSEELKESLYDLFRETYYEDVSQFEVIGRERYYLERGSIFSIPQGVERVKLLFDINPYNYNNDSNYKITYFKPNADGTRIALALNEGQNEIDVFALFNVTENRIELISNIGTQPNDLGGMQWVSNEKLVFTRVNSTLLNSTIVMFDCANIPNGFEELFVKSDYPDYDLPAYSYQYPIVTSNYLFNMSATVSQYNDCYFVPLPLDVNPLTNAWKPLYRKEEKINEFRVKNDSLYFLTSKNASNFKICKTSIKNPDFSKPELLVPEDVNAVITDFELVENRLIYVKTVNGVRSSLHIKTKEGINTIGLPDSFKDKSGVLDLSFFASLPQKVLLQLNGWNFKEEYHWYDVNGDTFNKENLFGESVEFRDVGIEELEVTANDGVRIPMTLLYDKSQKKDKSTPVLITAYGSYGDSYAPELSPEYIQWVRAGGIVAIAHVRGGGEKGDQWHRGGYKKTKPNSWNDLIKCTEFLIEEGYTEQDKIAAIGFSAGGIAVGRAITERPDLYKAVMLGVASLNAVKAELSDGGQNNVVEFGSMQNSLEASYLLDMDAYHNIKQGTSYPAVYVFAKLADFRLNPAGSLKFAKNIQYATTSNCPVLLDVDFLGGHNGFTIDDLSKMLAFALWQTEHNRCQ